LLLDLSGFRERFLLFPYPLQKYAGRFVGRVLRHEFSLDGVLEDGGAEVFDSFARSLQLAPCGNHHSVQVAHFVRDPFLIFDRNGNRDFGI